jgi:hypothetical protein
MDLSFSIIKSILPSKLFGEEPIYKFLTFDLIISHLIKIGHEGKGRVIYDVLRNLPTTFEKVPCMHRTWRPL